jgi:hypothetical protein
MGLPMHAGAVGGGTGRGAISDGASLNENTGAYATQDCAVLLLRPWDQVAVLFPTCQPFHVLALSDALAMELQSRLVMSAPLQEYLQPSGGAAAQAAYFRQAAPAFAYYTQAGAAHQSRMAYAHQQVGGTFEFMLLGVKCESPTAGLAWCMTAVGVLVACPLD